MDNHSNNAEPKKRYREKIRVLQEKIDTTEKTSRRVIHARLGCFLLTCLAGYFTYTETLTSARWAGLTTVGTALFFALVLWHQRIRHSLKKLLSLRKINQEALDRMARRWEKLPKIPISDQLQEDPTAEDLDLFGRASLFSLLGTVRTPHGRQALGRWFLDFACPKEISRRQKAVKELTPQLEMRQEFIHRADSLLSVTTDPQRFLNWVEEDDTFSPQILWFCYGLSWLLWLGVILYFLGLLNPMWILLSVALNTLVSFAYVERIHASYGRVSCTKGEFSNYSELFQHLQEQDFASDLNLELQQALGTDENSAGHSLRKLQLIMDFSELRYGSFWYLMLQGLTMWAFYIFGSLIRWRRQFKSKIRRWFGAAGDFEALCSIAGLSHDHPQWCFPKIDKTPEIYGEAVGHPLLPHEERVANDLPRLIKGQFLIVTGSNMSGKSTLLRSIGLNLILGRIGSPVCARGFTMPAPILATSIRVKDSLADGVSLFMAELLRLKEVIEIAKREHQSDAIVVCLLDEILRGTNATERHIAVVHVIQELLSSEATGSISTHDLALPSVPELNPVTHTVHFREIIHEDTSNPKMEFDYIIREGVSTTVNALKLLRIVGITNTPPPQQPASEN
ncbi:MAG: hypothetical protein VYA34_04340 [Myxococcota bacterium]|nr:hypothetical protein [Myxococcota bacterium]